MPDMSALLVMTAPEGPGEPYTLPPERIVKGSPTFVSWEMEKTADGKMVAGIWEATPGAWRSLKGPDWEFCHIISGSVEVTEDGKAPVLLKAGDVLVMRPGFRGTWRALERVRKSYVIYTA
jgi:uncharacterized cupin superfamily protein